MNIKIPLWHAYALVLAFFAVTWTLDWFTGQYEVTRRGRLGVRVTRRWYGTRAHVCFRSDADLEDPAWFRVLAWSSENTDVPWVLITPPDDEEFPACWCPVTDLAPYTVRRLRPWVFRYRWLRIPILFTYMPLRQPAGYLEDVA